MHFHPNLAKKDFLIDLPLCRVFLEDEAHYPWLILVPQRDGLARLIDLKKIDRLQVTEEVDMLQRVLWEEYKPTQLNVAAIGNRTPQLHIHIIARFETDPAWPQTVWDHPVRSSYTKEQKATVLTRLQMSIKRTHMDLA